MSENKSSISKAKTLEEIGKFWDEHDFTEFDTGAPDVVKLWRTSKQTF